MMDLLLHPETKRALEAFASNPSHAVALVGEPGTGKYTLARTLSAKLLQTTPEKLENHGYFRHIFPEKNSLSIETIRSLRAFLHLKTIGTNPIRRVVLIENAHTMTIEAQNAFLKILEEPPMDTVLILTIAGEKSLLPTIYSRLQTILVRPIDKMELETFAQNQKVSPELAAKAVHMSQGQAGLFVSLIEGDQAHPLVAGVEEARTLLGLPVYRRLKEVDRLAKDKDAAAQLLQALERLSAVASEQAATKDNPANLKAWVGRRERVLEAIDDLNSNVSNKLLLADLLLNL